MPVNNWVKCETFPCIDVKHDCYIVPDVDVKPELVFLMMISETTPCRFF